MTTKSHKTYVAKPSDLRPAWHVFDAAEIPLGRLASKIAQLLQGKHSVLYTATLNTGDFVIVVNAARVFVTGKKLKQKEYYFHSGYPGGFRTFTMEELLKRNPGRVVQQAVQGMLPRTTLGRQMLKRLKVYPGADHPHEAQVGTTGMVQE
jgi:large subunit ribosomal protein L13